MKGIKFAPIFDTPLSRRRETLAVFLWIASFLSSLFGTLFLLYLPFCTVYGWLVSANYFAWLFYDRETPNRGGRPSEFVRRWPLWKRYCAYFPISIVKTVDLDPSRNYLFCYHPHGVLCTGAFGNFGTEGTNVGKLFPGLKMHLLTLYSHCMIPIYREYLLCSGTCSATKESMNYLLSRPEGGHAAILVPGGAPEALDCHPSSYVLHLKNRKGFIKVAIRNGAPLVPVFSFGETDIYDQISNPPNSKLRRFQNKIQELFGVAPVYILGRGIIQYTFGIMPNRRPITTVVGAPIHVLKKLNPSQEEIDSLHKKYTEALLNLFYTYRDKYADSKAQLTII